MDSSGFWQEGCFRAVLNCLIRKFMYVPEIKALRSGTFLNSGLKNLFRRGISIVELFGEKWIDMMMITFVLCAYQINFSNMRKYNKWVRFSTSYSTNRRPCTHTCSHISRKLHQNIIVEFVFYEHVLISLLHNLFTARCYASAVLAMGLFRSVSDVSF